MTTLTLDGGFTRQATTLGGLRATIRAPGLVGTLTVGAPQPAVAAAGSRLSSAANDAVLDAGFQPLEAVRLAAVSTTGAGPATLVVAGSATPVLEIEIDAPLDEGTIGLLEVYAGDGAGEPILQWLLPDDVPVVGPAIAGSPPSKKQRYSITAPEAQAVVAAPQFVTRVVRFFRTRIDTAVRDLVSHSVVAAVRFVEGRLKTERLVRFVQNQAAPSGVSLAPLAASSLQGKRTLLLVHGIFSSADSFLELADPADGAPGVLHDLLSRYHGNVIAYDHWTVGKTPLENATDVLRLLQGLSLELDLVFVSRGGLVGRAMLEHDATDALRSGAAAAIHNAVFVCAANQGSPLANKNGWLRIVNVFTALGTGASLTGAASWVGGSLKLIASLMRLAVHAVVRLPSIAALAEDRQDDPNRFLRELNQSRPSVVPNIAAVRANYSAPLSAPLSLALDIATHALFFGNAPNDLVVPFKGAAGFDPGVTGTATLIDLPFGTSSAGQPDVHHTNFLYQPQVHGLMRQLLV